MKKLKNLSRVRIKGLNQERTLSKISKKFKLFNLTRVEKSLSELEVKNNDLKKVKAQFVSEGFEVEVLSSNGIIHFFKKFFKNYGVIAAIIISFAFYLFQFGFIWQVKVYGTEKIDSKEVVEYINQNFSKNKRQIKTDNIEISLKENFARISMVSVAIVGQSLVVNVHETIYPVEMEGQFSPIYAEVDCKVTSIELIQGTLAVKAGDIVQKGEVLVHPYIIDAEGQTREVNPQAIIKADVWLIASETHYDSYYKTYRTGESIESSRITLFGLEIYNNSKVCEFETFESETSSQYLSENQALPLIYEKTVYYETKTELVEQAFEEVKTQKIEEAKQKALLYFQEYDIIKSEDINISSGVGFTSVDVVITVERKIGVNYENLHKEN